MLTAFPHRERVVLLMSEVGMEKNMDESVTSTNTQASSYDSVTSEKPSVEVNDDGDGKSNNNDSTGAKHAQAVFFIKKLIHFYLASLLLPPALTDLENSQR